MDSDSKFLVWVSVCVTTGFLGLFGTIAFNVTNTNQHYYATANKCIESGGTWIPNSWGNCVGRAR